MDTSFTEHVSMNPTPNNMCFDCTGIALSQQVLVITLSCMVGTPTMVQGTDGGGGGGRGYLT